MRIKASWVISDETRACLERSEIFQDLGRKQLMEVAALVEEYSVDAEEMLLLEGDPARHLYVIVEGRAVAQLEVHRGWLSLGLVAPGDVAGWSSLVEKQTYPASVKALTPMQVARVEVSGLHILMNLDPEIGYSVNRRLSSLFCRQYRTALEAFKTSG